MEVSPKFGRILGGLIFGGLEVDFGGRGDGSPILVEIWSENRVKINNFGCKRGRGGSVWTHTQSKFRYGPQEHF